MNQETKQFIAENIDKNLHQLSLQSNRHPLVDMPLAIRQIGGRQKIQTKVSLFYNNENILYPAKLSLEQSSSEKTAEYKSTLCGGNTLLDLTGGFGVDCCFMSSHFKEVTYVERQAELCDLAKHNFCALNLNHIKIVHAETEKYIEITDNVDWIYIDPARRSINGKKLVLLSDCEPDVSALSVIFLEKAQNVMIKLSPMMDISAALRDLSQTAEVHIISVENECKEILLILNREPQKPIQFKTINFRKNHQNQTFTFYADDELKSISRFTSILEKYLYEPNAAVMKSGAFKLIGSHYDIKKLHTNTHLYTSGNLIADFPGRVFEIIKTWDNTKSTFKSIAQHCPKANISTRNYATNTEELRKKLKINDGGDTYLFACTLANEQKVIIECRKVSDNIR